MITGKERDLSLAAYEELSVKVIVMDCLAHWESQARQELWLVLALPLNPL